MEVTRRFKFAVDTLNAGLTNADKSISIIVYAQVSPLATSNATIEVFVQATGDVQLVETCAFEISSRMDALKSVSSVLHVLTDNRLDFHSLTFTVILRSITIARTSLTCIVLYCIAQSIARNHYCSISVKNAREK